jgi:hypothetical protein
MLKPIPQIINTPMSSPNLLQSVLLGCSLAGLGLVAAPLVAQAAMPSGYTLSPTPLKGQHCYRHNGEANLYCYRNKMTGSTMMQHNNMMKSGSSMMKSNDSMMKPGSSMMKSNDSMMKPGSTMNNNDNTMMKSNDSMMKK